VSIEEKMMMARMIMRAEAQYFTAALMGLIPYYTEEVPTCAVTKGMVLIINPTYLLSLTDMQAATRLWHEVQHVLRDSFEMFSSYDKVADMMAFMDVANRGQDLAINSSGRTGPWDFGPDGLLPAQFGFPEGLTAQEYILLLLDDQGKQQQQKKEKWGGCHGCGSASGKPADKELEEKIDAQMGRAPSDVKEIERQVARDIIKHNAKYPGTMTGAWEEWAKAKLEPAKVPWEQKFANMVRHCLAVYTPGGGVDNSYQHPARRSYVGPIGSPSVLYPGPVDPVIEAALILDTSGSMGISTDIAIALREMRAVVESVGQRECWLLEVDAEEAAKARRVTPPELISLNIHGRGGTDFRPAFTAIEKLNPKPSVAIYMTDGMGPAPTNKPANLEVIWCLVGEGRKAPTSWGHVVHVKD